MGVKGGRLGAYETDLTPPHANVPVLIYWGNKIVCCGNKIIYGGNNIICCGNKIYVLWEQSNILREQYNFFSRMALISQRTKESGAN